MIRFFYTFGVVFIGTIALLGLTKVVLYQVSPTAPAILAIENERLDAIPEESSPPPIAAEPASPDIPYLLARRDEIHGKYDAAFKLYEKSAALDYPPAFLALSDLHALGHGTPVNQQKSLYYLKKAADEGMGVAQYNYANKLRDMNKTPEDLLSASYYYSLAAGNGIKFAQQYLRENEEKCLAASLQRTENDIRACLLASHAGNGGIEAVISALYRDGNYLQTDAGKIAAIHDFLDGNGTKRDPAQAYILYKSINAPSPEQKKCWTNCTSSK